MTPAQLILAVVLSGFVVDSNTEEPIPQAVVAIPFVTEELQTDDRGFFSIEVGPGRYDLYIRAPHYEELRVLELPVSVEGISEFVFRLNLLGRYMPESAVYQIQDVSVTASRGKGFILETPREVFAVAGERFRDRIRPGTPEALEEIPQVLVQKTSLGGGAPIVRGLSGNRILLLVDGVRLNNSTYRIGLNQYLNTVDPGIVERIEVVPGSGSVLYGSDALGGVIQVFTASPNPDMPDLAYSGHVATSEGSQVHGLRLGRWWGSGGLIVGLGLRDLNDLKGGGSIGSQEPTGYSEWSGAGRWVQKVRERDEFTLAYQISRQDDVPRIDRIIAGKDSLWLYDPQHRELLLARYESSRPFSQVERMSFTASWNHQREGRKIIQNSQKDIFQEFLDDVQTFGLAGEAQSLLGGKTLLNYGAEVYFDLVDSRGSERSLENGDEEKIAGKFPDDGEHLSLGVFLQGEQTLSRTAKLIGALRFSSFHLEGTPQGPFGKVKLDNRVLTAALQSRLQVGAQSYLFGGISQSFRAPNMEDALSAGLSNKGFDVPNPDLEPERGWNFEAGFKSSGRIGRDLQYRGDATAYLTLVEEFIERAPATFQGSDSLEGAPVFHNENQGRARIMGLSGSGEVQLDGAWQFRTSISWTHGMNTDLDVPLTRIPPLRGTLSARRSWESLWLETVFQWAARQNRLSPDDERDSRIPEGGTPEYFVAHVRGGYRITPDLALRLSLENVGDAAYKIHGSGIYMSGRNLIAGLEWGLP